MTFNVELYVEEKKPAYLATRLSQNDFDFLKSIAEEYRITVSALARAVLKSYIAKKKNVVEGE